MPLSLRQHLAAVHKQLSLFLTADAVLMCDTVLQTLIGNPAHLLPGHQSALALATLPPTFFRMSPSLELVEVTPALLELLEVEKADDLLGQNWEQFLDLDGLKRRWEAWGVAAQTRNGFTHTFTFHTPTGRRLTLCERVMPLRDNQTLVFTGWFAHVRVVAKVIKLNDPRRTGPPTKLISA